MKKILYIFSSVFILVCCISFISCSYIQTNSQNLFLFLSVRLKGNGDGTITAVAQNEFSICSSIHSVTLTIYYSSEQTDDTSHMLKINSISKEDLSIFQSITLNENIQNEGYYCAEIKYKLDEEIKCIQSELIYYDINGKIKHGTWLSTVFYFKYY